MSSKRKKFTGQEKVRILRLHLVEKRPISDVCNEIGLNPNMFYRWQQQFFENGAVAFDLSSEKGRKDSHTRKLEEKVAKLESKLVHKDEVIAEIMASHVELKKSLGED